MSTRHIKYKVASDIKKPWFKKPKLVYYVVKEYEYYDNNYIYPASSCWRNRVDTLVECLTREEAENIVKELSK